MRITNPKDDTLLREVPEDTATTVEEKFGQAKRAQREWPGVPIEERCAVLARFRDAVIDEQESLALLLTREVGKPIAQSRNELRSLTSRLDFFLEATPHVLAPEEVYQEPGPGAVPALREVIHQEPLGTILNVSAWNYPWFVGTNVFVPALLTGNSVIYKPSELATLTGLEMERLLHASGVPKHVFRTVVGGPRLGEALLSRPFDGVFFTGSYKTGHAIASALAGRMVRTGFELGDKSPIYVADDVSIDDAAASLADGAMYNAGQSCCSVERIYVHERVTQAFVDAFVQVVRGFEIGDPEREETYIGPLARHAQVQVLEEMVADAVAKGAQLLVGGKRWPLNANYFEPTVLVGVTDDMRVMREEAFGPIIGIATVANDDEAVRCMNSSQFGLTSGIYTTNELRAQRVLAQLNAGSVYWNCCDRVSPRLPWTGRGHSGMGSTLSTHGIRTFVQPKAWHLRAP
jgi:acyl-CoA reductase-like NAD-dependent aldehyde dehydrogenase